MTQSSSVIPISWSWIQGTDLQRFSQKPNGIYKDLKSFEWEPRSMAMSYAVFVKREIAHCCQLKLRDLLRVEHVLGHVFDCQVFGHSISCRVVQGDCPFIHAMSLQWVLQPMSTNLAFECQLILPEKFDGRSLNIHCISVVFLGFVYVRPTHHWKYEQHYGFSLWVNRWSSG